MLRAVHAALQSGKAEEGVDFADNVNSFLRDFGMRRDWQALTEAAAKAGGAVGSQAWFAARFNLVGEQLLDSGQTKQAEDVFADILAGLEQAPSGNRCLTLGMLAQCCKAQGQLAETEQLYRQELAELSRLEQLDGVRRQSGLAQTDLADVLADQGRYTEAKAAYRAGLKIAEEQGDELQIGALSSQLGTFACKHGDLAEAAEWLQEALSLWQNLNNPSSEAVTWHELGIVYQKAEQWKAAEDAYRQAAQLKEEQGLLIGSNGAGSTWHNLAVLCKDTGRQAEAEQWYRKALAARRAADDQLGIARTLSNIADLLIKVPARLEEARSLAEESLAIKESLDPAAAEIWKTYDILANIATKQGESSQAAAYRAKSRQAYLAFPGWRQQLYQHEELIAAVIKGSGVEAALTRYGEVWANLIAAIRHILSGERDEADLCGPLGWEEAAIIRAILEGIAGAA